MNFGLIKQEIIKSRSDRCHYCGCKCTLDQDPVTMATVDHLIPRSMGGGNDLDNLVLACLWCNHTKDSMLPEMFIVLAPWRNGKKHAVRTSDSLERYVRRGLKIRAKIQAGQCPVDFDTWLAAIPKQLQDVVAEQIQMVDAA